MPRPVRTLPNRWALANNAGVNGKRAGPALPSYGRVARVPFRDQGSFAVERPAPGRTGDERESLVAASVRGSNVRRGSRIAPGVGHSTKLCLAERLASFTHGDFRKLRFFNGKCENSRAEPNIISS
jgi:hypothetical protein